MRRCRQLPPSGTFGTEAAPDFVFHSIVGVQSEATADDPIQAVACATASSAGAIYQSLSVHTGGVRFPICSQNYTSAFQSIADNAVRRTRCRYSLDLAGLIDTDRLKVNVTYTTGAGVENRLPLSPAASCARGWQYDASQGKVVLCSETCADVLSDTEGSVQFVIGCDSI